MAWAGQTTFVICHDWGAQHGIDYGVLPDEDQVIRDICGGQFEKPLSVAAFNVIEGWARDVTQDIAKQRRETGY